ncbi:MAG: agmatinase [Candidatus Aenigmatarchaeota archaeon]
MEIPFNFLGIPAEYCDNQKSKVFILPVPFAGTVTFGKGTDDGPRAIIEASKNQVEWYDEELGVEALNIGIHTLPAVKVEKEAEATVRAVEEKVSDILALGKFPVMLGGEHSVSVGMARALIKKYTNVSVLQIDAHSDLRNEYDFNKYSHACAMRRVSDLGATSFVQVGIRSQDVEEIEFLRTEQGKKHHIFCAKDIHGTDRWIDDAISKLGENVFITIDVDGFDPSIMPATGTPEPGGLDWYTAIKLLRRVCEQKNVVGFDVVELAPIKNMHAPNFLCARLVYKLIGYKFAKELKKV